MPLIPTLTTPRLILRSYTLADFDAYAAMWSEPGVVRFIGGAPLSREVAWARFLRQFGLWHHLGFGGFVVEDRASGVLIGEVGFHDLRRAIVPSLEGTMETGWVLVGAAQGKGLAEEAVRVALGWADTHHAGTRITCMIQSEHAASLHVAGKLGFVPFADTLYNGNEVTLLERPRPSGAG
ncbi:GNAT family N-acetyltransferase [Ancylobacter pratisalsi]|uniref:GNAT family N-acetyltransferase n=1 Tax=Ancylobacter pratisalsi TaxID=1745854 RepID=A0A6P1YGQ8_9HYPH|nr:GNAT family N-acetyltransferase [Ancylobacter pratisalsi]QIB32488.1 GNAT family N-acetyltransferase [Ancylobacter pratisalsi]